MFVGCKLRASIPKNLIVEALEGFGPIVTRGDLCMPVCAAAFPAKTR
jgi:hypothetical protein